jgi:hypothetical protein
MILSLATQAVLAADLPRAEGDAFRLQLSQSMTRY